MGQFLWLLDNGNGGVMDGIYRTPGKRSPKWADGSQLFEGEFNRAIVNRVVELCVPEGIRYQVIAPELEDISLGERVRRANAYHAQDSCIFVSIHSNAGGGTGYEVFTSKGETKSDQVATVFFDHFQAQFPHKAMRSDVSDGDVDKEDQVFFMGSSRIRRILFGVYRGTVSYR